MRLDISDPRVTPSFFLLGAAKAGTGAFIDLLAAQPGIFVAPRKESNYFALGGRPPRFTGPGDDAGINRRSIWRQEEYEALFRDAAPGQLAGEASVIYLASPTAAAAIRNEVPDARLVAILRDPVERAFSAYRHMRRDGREEHAEFREALAAEPGRVAAGWEPIWHYERLGRYAEQLGAWLEYFPRRQMHLIRYERFRDAPRSVLVEACRFLDVEAKNFEGLTKRVNVSGVPRSRLLQRILIGDGLIKRVARPLLPAWLRRPVWQVLMRRNTRRTPARLPFELETRLRDRFRPEVERLEKLLGWDLTSWKEGRTGGRSAPAGDGWNEARHRSRDPAGSVRRGGT